MEETVERMKWNPTRKQYRAFALREVEMAKEKLRQHVSHRHNSLANFHSLHSAETVRRAALALGFLEK